MRTARLVGLSQDGQTLIVVTDTGEELGIPADDRLRAALRGDRPRLGQLEIEMDSALTPRDIQTRIRAGESLEDVARVAGIPLDRVERFAAPVLAERDHVARLAMAASVRRRGETSGHRNLRFALTERLVSRGVDIDTVEWDSFRMEDGRWSVSAAYRSGEAEREAVFYYDIAGRFSVAGNDEARWVLGEHSSVKGPQPGRRRPEASEPDTEPTLDLSDELALVRAIQEPAPPPLPPALPPVEESSASVSRLHAVASAVEAEIADLGRYESDESDREPATDGSARQSEGDGDTGRVQEATAASDDGEATEASAAVAVGADTEADVEAEDTEGELEDLEAGDRSEFNQAAHFEVSSLTWDQEHEEALEEEAAAERSELEALYGMLGGDGYAEDSPRVYSGLSDASAVPETDNAGWEPAIVVDYPVEPSEHDPLDPETPDDEWRRGSPITTMTESNAHALNPPLEDEAWPGLLQPEVPETTMQREIPESTAYKAPTPREPSRQSAPNQPVPETAPTERAADPAPTEPAGDTAAQEPAVDTSPQHPAVATASQEPALPTAPAETPVQATEVPAEPAAQPLPLDASEGEPEPEAHPGAPKKPPAKRKRASVPSWDEIMFGGPKRPS
ncbi:MAG: hypothetical protein QOF52_3 [Propionibacteriaceae bacterium]|jgi:hypothetical protein|nr:hypothetical protein [Propionibacteriaceae bacterium]